MKLYRNAIILVVILGLLVGGYTAANKFKKGDSTANNTTSRGEVIKLVDVNSDDISEMTVTSKDGKYTLTKKTVDNNGTKDSQWWLSSPESRKADNDKVRSMAINLSSIIADKLIEEDASDLSKYGLNAPVLVSGKLSDGSVKEIEIGNKTPSKDAYYVKEKGNNKVCTVGNYTIDKILLTQNDVIDKTLFTIVSDDVIAFTLEKDGKLVFTSNKGEDKTWTLSAPIKGNADSAKITGMLDAVTGTAVMNYIDSKGTDLDKYGLKNPLYGLEVVTAGTKTKLLLGSEKEKGTERYAKLANSNEVFTVDETKFTFLDVPLKEVMESFAYITNIADVSKVVVEMDGRVDTLEIQANADASKTDEDKFTFNGKDASGKDDKGNQPVRKYYQGLIGILMSDLDIGAKPSGKPEITITYYLKKAPGTMKVELIPKDNYYYYVVKNGEYNNMIVSKKQLDEPDALRDSYKKLIAVIK